MAEEGSSGGSNILGQVILLAVGVGGGYLAYRYKNHLLNHVHQLEKEKEELKAELSRFKRERDEMEHAI